MCDGPPGLGAEAAARRLVERGEVPELGSDRPAGPGSWAHPYGWLPTYPAPGDWGHPSGWLPTYPRRPEP